MKRTNSLGVAKVKWEVLNSVENLEETSGTITFPAGETTAILRLKLEPDNVSLVCSVFITIYTYYISFNRQYCSKFRGKSSSNNDC